MNPTSEVNAAFGEAVDIDLAGNTVIVGAPDRDLLGAGAAFRYELIGATWSLAQTLTASDATSSTHFGHDVAIGDVDANPSVFVSALGIYNTPRPVGSVYGFKLSAASPPPPGQTIVPYFQNQKIVPLFGEQDFGYSIDVVGGFGLSKSTLAVGDPVTRTVNTYVQDGYSWIPTNAPTVNTASQGFGTSVSIGSDNNGTTLIVGAPLDGNGKVHVYRRTTAPTYSLKGTISNPTAGTGSGFGSAVAYFPGGSSPARHRLIVGAPNTSSQSGLAFTFLIDDLLL